MTYSARQLSSLDEFLTDCFSSFELMQLSEQLGGREVSVDLPGTNLPRASFTFETVRVLARHGLINARLFSLLERARPNRRADLRRLASIVLQEPPGAADDETTVWRPAESHEARRLSWVVALEDALLRRDQCHDEAERAERGREIDSLARHLRAIPHIGPGSVVAGARLERRIGAGNFGTVWYGHHMATGAPVATKIFNLDRCTDELMLWRFRRSIRALKQIGAFRDAPRTICRVQDVSPDTLAFCMPYMAEGNLEQIERRGWSRTTKIAVFLEVCRAVAFAHRIGVIHRDIKPANILLDAEGRPVLIDFDIADIRFVTVLEAERAGVGTPVFAAPEQLERADAADERSDVYSLGRLLYYLLLERSPGYQREDDPRLDNLRGFPSALVSIIRRATQALPARRYESVAQMIAAVERYPTGYAAVKARVGSGARWLRQHFALMATGMTVISSSVALNYVQEQRLRDRDRFLAEGQRILRREDEHGVRVREGIAQLADYAAQTATIEQTLSGCLKDEEKTRLGGLQRSMQSLQGELGALVGGIETERAAMKRVLELDPGVFDATGTAPPRQADSNALPTAAADPVTMGRNSELTVVGPSPELGPPPLLVPGPASSPAAALAEPAGAVTHPSPLPAPRTVPNRGSVARRAACKKEFSALMNRVEPKICGMLQYRAESRVHLVIHIDQHGRFSGWEPPVELKSRADVKSVLQELQYPQSCAGESRSVDQCASFNP